MRKLVYYILPSFLAIYQLTEPVVSYMGLLTTSSRRRDFGQINFFWSYLVIAVLYIACIFGHMFLEIVRQVHPDEILWDPDMTRSTWCSVKRWRMEGMKLQ